MFSFDIKRRSVHFLVKSALGRFLKNIDRNHIEGVTFGTTGMQFELVNVELNETIFNEELLVDSPLRLVSGSINSIKGTLGFQSSETRDLTIEGVDLTFDVQGNNKAREANPEEGATHHRRNHGAATSGGTTSGSGEFRSVMSGPISRDELRNEILQGEQEDEQVREGVSALSEVIKNLVHSMTFTAEHVNIRLRFPPPGTEIVCGQPPPEGSIELLLSLPNQVNVSNVDNGTAKHGNSFQKEIRFSGLRVALYDVASRVLQDEFREGEDVQHVKASSIIFGGPVEKVGNVIKLRFIDVDTVANKDARWEVGFYLNELRSIISPSQLSRLGVVMNALLGAPDADENAGSESTGEDTSKFTLNCSAMSLALLQEDNEGEVGTCWKVDEGRATTLSTPHYAVSIIQGAFQVLDSTPATSIKDDPFHEVFKRFPGRCYSIGIANFSVVEKRPGPHYVPQTLLTFRANNGAHPAPAKSLLCVVRTTCPMHVASAKDVGVQIPDGHDMNLPISRMDVSSNLTTELELTVDVDILDRVVKFAAQVGQLFYAKQQLGTLNQQRSSVGGGGTQYTTPGEDIEEEDMYMSADGDGGNSPFDDFGSVASGGGFKRIGSAISMGDMDASGIRPSHAARSNAVPVTSSSPPAATPASAYWTDQDYYDDLERKEYLTLSSVSLKSKQLTFHVKFPSDKKPDPDLYGPLTQQLFASLVSALDAQEGGGDGDATTTAFSERDANSLYGAGLGGKSVVSSASRWTVASRAGGPSNATSDSHHLNKALLIEVKDLMVNLPDGSSSIVDVDGASAAVYLFDVETRARGEPILELVLKPQKGRSKDDGPHHFCKVLIRPESTSPQSATSLVFHPELTKGPTLIPSEVQFSSTDDSAISTKQRQLSAGSDMHITIKIDSAKGNLHQDDLLLMMFMIDEVLGCVSKASRRLDRVISQQDTLAVAGQETLGDSRRTIPESTVAMDLGVREVRVVVWAPRLCANGKPAGQPLFMTLPKRCQDRSTEYSLYHRYKISGNALDVFLYSFTHPWRTGLTGVAENKPKTDSLINVQASYINLAERLPSKARSFVPPDVTPGCTSKPKWEKTTPLLSSYASVYKRLQGEATSGAHRPLVVFVRRSVDLEQLQVRTTVNVHMDRISVPHQVAHVGDHWLFALLAFVGDSPVATAGSAPVEKKPSDNNNNNDNNDDGAVDDSSDSGDSSDSTVSNAHYTQPMTTLTNVTVIATNTLIDYQPFGYGCRIAAVVPVLKVKTGDLLGHRPDAHIKVYLQLDRQSNCEVANVLFHHNFSDLLVNSEKPEEGSLGSGGSNVLQTHTKVARNDVIVADLQRLGFVQMLSLKSLSKGATIKVDIGGPEQPTKVQVRELQGQFTCAKDSFQYFQIALSHYLGGLDAQFLPTPQIFVKDIAKGRHIIKGNLPAEAPTHKKFDVIMNMDEEVFESRIRQCINSIFVSDAHDNLSVLSDMDVFEGIEGSTMAHQPQTDSDDYLDADGFEVVGGSPEWAWSKTMINLATYDGDNRALADDMGLRLSEGGLMPADEDERQEPDAAFSLADLEVRGHFAAKPDALDAAFTRGFSLIGCPPVEVEVMLLRCEGTVKLFAGLDFATGGSTRGCKGGTSPTTCNDVVDEDESLSHRAPDVPVEAICASIKGVNAQIDLFREGFDLGMRAYVEVKDIEVEDRIAESEVRTLFMASVPKAFRDPSSSMLELQWTTILPSCAHAGMANLSEEQLSLRLEPFVLTLHRRAIDMLIEFTADEQDQWKRLNIEVPPSTMYFNRIFIHPVVATVNVLFEVQNLSKVLHGEMTELCHLLPTLEGSKVQLNEIDIRSCHINDLPERLTDLLSSRMLTMNAIFLLLCGVQPVRAATEMGKASVGLLIQPLEHYKRNRSVYAGILRGIQAFSRVSAAELLKMGAGATRTAHNMTNMSTGTYSRSLARGSQPTGFGDGMMRAAREMQQGVGGAIDVMMVGGLQETWRVPPIITDGFLKAFTEVLQGLRNNVSPSDMNMDLKLYKSHAKDKEKDKDNN